jgi:hypothetical protein
MRPYISFDAGIEDGRLQPLWEDGERSLCREKRERRDVLVLRLIAEPDSAHFSHRPFTVALESRTWRQPSIPMSPVPLITTIFM